MSALAKTAGIVHVPKFVSEDDRAELQRWLESIHPLWEDRHGPSRGLRQGQERRRLLRPVYWLGGWQFACRNYFHPPLHVDDRVMHAEPFPPPLARLVRAIEQRTRRTFAPEDVPEGWKLNTCLVNFYGLARKNDRWVDRARVGGHRDFEAGPVASLSLGAKALFQFATRARGPEDEDVVLQEWLRDRSLLVFGTPRWKHEVFHRVPRVAREDQHHFDLPVEGFRIRRVNLTLRYVPDANIVRFAEMSELAREEVRGYVQTLAEHSPFFARELAGETSPVETSPAER